MKKSNRKEITYGEFGSLEVVGLVPVIMDFDRSLFEETDKCSLYHDLDRFIGLMSLNCNIKFYYNDIESFLDKNLKPFNSPVNPDICNRLCNYIDKLEIRRVDSEPRSMPNWLKPQRN